MGMCKVDIYEEDRRFTQEYDLATPAGVTSLFNDWHRVCASAARGNLAVVDALVDIAVALDDAGLTRVERHTIRLVLIDGLSEYEAASEMGVDVAKVVAAVTTSVEKVANYLGGSEGYPREV